MKRIINFFALLMCLFTVGGCNKNKIQTNISKISYLEPISQENIAYNLKLAAREIKSIVFEGKISIDNKEYVFNGKAIINETIANSLLYIEFDNNHLYLKNGKIYLSYFYNNTNVVVKDSITNCVKEIADGLSLKGIAFNEENVIEFINNKTINDIDFNSISEKVVKVNEGYNVNYQNLNLKLDDKYFVRQLSFIKDRISIDIDFNYSQVKVNVPLGYEIFNVNIGSIKKLLKTDNLLELIK